MKTISVDELKSMMDNQEEFTLIDVREQNEYDQGNIDALHVPMSVIASNVDKFPKEGTVVVHCRSGNRSGKVIQFLEQNHGHTNLINLEGGMLAWKEEIDSSFDID